MSGKKFPNHEGGVIRVQHSERWGSVPEALLEDARLALDSRAVAAWLAVKPSGWQIVIDVLQRRLGMLAFSLDADGHIYRPLSKERWQRIAKELELAGYLKREVTHGRGGKWIWNITFNPRPPLSEMTVAGFSSYGETARGLAGSGQAGADKASNKGIPIERDTTVTTTTTTDVAEPSHRFAGSVHGPRSVNVVVDRYAEKHRDILLQLLAGAELTDEEGQQIADEFAGVLEAAAASQHVGIRSVRAWLVATIKRHRHRQFVFEFGRSVAARRTAVPASANKPKSVERSDQRVASSYFQELRSKLGYSVPKERQGRLRSEQD